MMSFRLGLSASYWTYFFYGGISMPWWPVWLSSRGLSEVEIADLLAFERLVIVAASLVVAHYADRTGHRRRILLIFFGGVTIGYAMFGLAIELCWHYFAIATLVADLPQPAYPRSATALRWRMSAAAMPITAGSALGTISFIWEFCGRRYSGWSGGGPDPMGHRDFLRHRRRRFICFRTPVRRHARST